MSNIKNIAGSAGKWVAKKLFTTKARLSLYKKLKGFVANGIPMLEILQMLEKEYSRSDDVTDMKKYALRDWIKKMDVGEPLFKAVEGWIPENEVMLIRAGEESGDVASSFDNCINATSAITAMKGTIIGALTYPVGLLFALFGMIGMFSVKIVPTMTRIKPPEEWPAVSQDLYTLSEYVIHHWHHTLIGIAVGVFLIVKSLGLITGIARGYLDKFPPYSFYRSFQSSVFLISMSALMRSNVTVLEALIKLRSNANRYVASEINKIADKISTGTATGESFRTNFFDEETKVDIAVYANTGDIASYMDDIGKGSIENSVAAIGKIANLVKLIMFLVVAVFIGWAYYSFFAVTQSMN